MMYLINTVYFLADWTHQFDTNLTVYDEFYTPYGSDWCHMMEKTSYLAYHENELFQAVNLPYGNGNYGMAILLPREGNSNGDVDQLIARLSVDNWNQWSRSFGHQHIRLRLPRFHIEYEIGLKSILSQLGMQVAFDPCNADFSGIADPSAFGNLYIGDVRHKTYLDVCEAGTEAAAVTVVGIIATTMDPPPPSIYMTVDRPFVCIIHDNRTGDILFIGRVMSPR